MPTSTILKSSTSFIKAFKEHPKSVGETYWGHFFFALATSFKLLCTSFALVIHAIIPPLFETTGSDTITNMYQKLQKRNNMRNE